MKAIIKNTSLNYDYYNTYNISLNETTSVDVKVSANVYKVANEIDCYDCFPLYMFDITERDKS